MTIHHQWPFQDPKLEVPTIYKAYPTCSMYGIFTNICPQNHPNVVNIPYMEHMGIFQAYVCGNIPTIHMTKNIRYVPLRSSVLNRILEIATLILYQ